MYIAPLCSDQLCGIIPPIQCASTFHGLLVYREVASRDLFILFHQMTKSTYSEMKIAHPMSKTGVAPVM
jgi:hypothetical protein